MRDMKKSKLLSILAGIILIIASCEDVFDVERVGVITPESMWTSSTFISKYVNNMYTILPSWNRLDVYSDEANPADITTTSFLKGKLLSTDAFPGQTWNYSYVRNLNEFFARMKTAKALLTDTEKSRLMGQAYFFRAYVYYKMLESYGGVPIITTVQDPTANPTLLYVTRNTSLECFNFVLGQLDSAITLLPPRGTSGYDAERITKAAAMTVKGKVLLLKASPLFCKTPNSQFWSDAYNALVAAKTELDAEGYGMYQDGTKRATENMWYNKTAANKEMVIYVAYNDPAKKNTHQAAQLPLSQSSGATGGQEPTWELVQAYPMNDGKSIDGNPAYDPTMFWKNRDPRFYTTVVYNGALYGLGKSKYRQWIFEEYSGGGTDGYRAVDGTYTGFYCRKGIDTTYGKFGTKPFQDQAMDWAVIRYPEVMLDIAECANEIDAHRSEVTALITAIRARTGIPAGAGSLYGLDVIVGTDKAASLNAIMKERQIELAFEGKRYWDLRRRRMFSGLNTAQHMHAMKTNVNRTGVVALGLPGITLTSDITTIMAALTDLFNKPGTDVDAINKQVTTYTVEIIDNSAEGQINIPDKYYFYPIHPDYLKQNPQLKQTTGWENGDFEPTIQ
jgi:starch-binding outer membrane protein, SusD/RagB family